MSHYELGAIVDEDRTTAASSVYGKLEHVAATSPAFEPSALEGRLGGGGLGCEVGLNERNDFCLY